MLINTSSIHMATNPAFHKRTKYIEVDCHFIHNQVETKVITFPHASLGMQLVNLSTRAMTRDQHWFLVGILMLLDHPHQFEGECERNKDGTSNNVLKRSAIASEGAT